MISLRLVNLLLPVLLELLELLRMCFFHLQHFLLLFKSQVIELLLELIHLHLLDPVLEHLGLWRWRAGGIR